LIIANDVKGTGHFTEYPGDKESVALQVSFRDGVVPKHEVVERSACLIGERNCEERVGGGTLEVVAELL
jgi:hypothetical protein